MKFSALVSGTVFAAAASAQQSAWGQCGGTGWSGQTSCVSGYACVVVNPYYSQCQPGTAPTTPTTSSSTPTATGKTQFAGVNIAGFDFGCTTDGSCNISQVVPPLSAYNGPDGAGQMSHFVNDDKLNIFRLPVGWQFLLNNNLGGQLDGNNFPKYDALVQACLNTGAYCIVDIHNYARWNGQIVGQGGPSNAQLASTWSQLATKYAGKSKVIFGIMNEPHDIPNMNTWAATVQASVTAIRQAGATSQMILLPGNAYTAANQFVDNGSLAALKVVTNPDGSTTNLIFDVHQYLDSDNSGTHSDCVTDHASDFQSLASALRQAGRKALLSETGGGNTSSCETDLCSEFATLDANSDVFLGYVGWAAGSFDQTYTLVLTPTKNGGSWQDQPLVTKCLARK